MPNCKFLILLPLIALVTACCSPEKVEKGAFFQWFEYEGNDESYSDNLLGGEEIYNPDLSGSNLPSGNFMIRDDFSGDSLELYWDFIQTPEEDWYALENNELKMDFKPVSFREKKNPAFIGRRQQHKDFTVSTGIRISPENKDDRAGLVCFRAETNNYFLGVAVEQDELIAFVEKTIVRDGNPVKKRLAMKKTGLGTDDSVFLKIEGRGEFLDFLISEDNEPWETLAGGQDATYLSTDSGGGFAGTYIGMYASSLEE
jgi:xylan 1,4-beta-xylosidase